jgi:Lipase (class 3)
MFTIPYDVSRTSLYHPGEATDFFQYGPSQTQNEAALCAEMARLAYVKQEERLGDYLDRAQLDLQGTIGYGSKEKGTQLFIAKSRPESGGRPIVVVSFRGTEPDDPFDLISDARLIQKSWCNVRGDVIGSVHAGFADALLADPSNDNILEKVIIQLTSLLAANPSRTLLTGHSLGAALATLTASYLTHNLSGMDMHLYTFGSPLIGDSAFARWMATVDHARYVDCCDLVTRIPPQSLGYVHVGSLRYIDREGQIFKSICEDDISTDRMMAAMDYLEKYSFLLGTVGVREMADHSPINYVSSVTQLRH